MSRRVTTLTTRARIEQILSEWDQTISVHPDAKLVLDALREALGEPEAVDRAVAAIEAIHVKFDNSRGVGRRIWVCRHDNYAWPCPTLRALEESLSAESVTDASSAYSNSRSISRSDSESGSRSSAIADSATSSASGSVMHDSVPGRADA